MQKKSPLLKDKVSFFLSKFHWGTFETVPAGHRLDIIEVQDPRTAGQDVTMRQADYYFVCVNFTVPDVKQSLKFHNIVLL